MTYISEFLKGIYNFFFTSPTFQNEESKTRQAYLLNFILLNYWIVALITLVLLFLSEHKEGINFILFCFIIFLLIIEFIKYYSKNIFIASIVLNCGLWLFTTMINVLAGKGISIFSIWYVPVIIIVGLLLGRKPAIFAFILTVFTTIILLYMHEITFLSNSYFSTNQISNWVIFFIALVQTYGPVDLLVQSLNRNASSLETKVEDQTNELELAKKDLELYLYSLSHDLRNPLELIHGLVQSVYETYVDQLPPSAKEMLEKIQLNSNRMINLTNELLQFFTMKKELLKKQQLNMKEIVKTVLGNFEEERSKRDINLKIDELPDNIGDRVLITQVWVNLISNAFKYTRFKTETVIKISYQLKEKRIVYYISDNGIGFDMDKSKSLFQPFERLPNSERFEGTGIGLAFVQSIITKHGGKLWFNAKLNEGATFYFTLG